MAHSQTCRDDRPRHHRWAVSRTSDDGAGAGKSGRAYFLAGNDVAAVGARHQSTRLLDPVSASAATGEPDQQPIAVQSPDGSGDLEDRVRCIVNNAPPLTEARRGRRATLICLHAADPALQESRRYRGHFKLRQPAAAVEAARMERHHR
jgi:hypothetical protein